MSEPFDNSITREVSENYDAEVAARTQYQTDMANAQVV